MLSKEDLKLLSELMDEKLAPIRKDMDNLKEGMGNLKEDMGNLKEDMDIIKEDMKEVKGVVNILSQWAEAATEYHIHEIHYPLEDDEIVR